MTNPRRQKMYQSRIYRVAVHRLSYFHTDAYKITRFFNSRKMVFLMFLISKNSVTSI